MFWWIVFTACFFQGKRPKKSIKRCVKKSTTKTKHPLKKSQGRGVHEVLLVLMAISSPGKGGGGSEMNPQLRMLKGAANVQHVTIFLVNMFLTTIGAKIITHTQLSRLGNEFRNCTHISYTISIVEELIGVMHVYLWCLFVLPL